MTFPTGPALSWPQQLRAARRHLHITQADLAARLQVTVQTISNWETGRTEPWPREQCVISGLLIEWLSQPAAVKKSRIIDRINGHA